MNDMSINRYKIEPHDQQQIETAFTQHPATHSQAARYEAIRTAGREMSFLILEACPDTGDRSTALQRIRDAVMWANNAIACGESEAMRPRNKPINL